MKVKINSFFTLKGILGEGEVSLDNCDGTMEGLLKELSRQHGEKFSNQLFDPQTGKLKFCRLVLNGRQCISLETHLKDGDLIEFHPFFGGG